MLQLNTQFQKGHIPWNKGKKMDEEFCKINADAHKGLKHSEETREKISRTQKEYYKIHPEKKEYLSKALKGNKNSLGYKHSIKTRQKRSEMRKGDKCNFWKGGVWEGNNKIRKSLEMKFWRESIFEEDNFTCQKCFLRGGELTPHHIKNFAQYPELRFAIDNGITFCKECHDKFHKIYGKRNNTGEQIKEFLTINLASNRLTENQRKFYSTVST